ncbi:ABC-type amino acid transport/signal transduction systems, periplasmic component/domain [Pseudoalteromonas luteoviolacea B = ATCC 29581]|nr:ABC-type amino acid transport/signal transduction systems, periplasmic component/domain [Pseudoalteromonas luteoviolacea B = ATCC 29581]
MRRVILAVTFALVSHASIGDLPVRLDVYTEEFPPFQTLISPGKVGGIATGIVEAVLRDSNIPYQIHLMPWFRSTTNVEKYPNSLIYSLARTPSRENQFHWLVPLCPINVAFYRLTTRDDINIKRLEDAKKYVVAVAAGQPSETYLLNQGFTPDSNLVVLASHEQGAGMLEKKRIDLLFGAEQFFDGVVHDLNLEGQWEQVLKIDELSRQTYLAANKAISQEYVQRIKASFERVQNQLQIESRCDQIKTR